MSAWDDLTYAASALEMEPREYFRAEYAGTAPLLARILRRTAREAVGLHDGQVEDLFRPELLVARSVLGRMADDPIQPAQAREPLMSQPQPLTTRSLERAIGLALGGGADQPLVAVTPHGSYTFAVDSLTFDGARVVLGLREVERATDRSA